MWTLKRIILKFWKNTKFLLHLVIQCNFELHEDFFWILEFLLTNIFLLLFFFSISYTLTIWRVSNFHLLLIMNKIIFIVIIYSRYIFNFIVCTSKSLIYFSRFACWLPWRPIIWSCFSLPVKKIKLKRETYIAE